MSDAICKLWRTQVQQHRPLKSKAPQKVLEKYIGNILKSIRNPVAIYSMNNILMTQTRANYQGERRCM